MTDEPETTEEEAEVEEQDGELLPPREAMSVLNPVPHPYPGEITFPSEPGIGDPQPS